MADWDLSEAEIARLGAFHAPLAALGEAALRPRMPEDPPGGVYVYHDRVREFLRAADAIPWPKSGFAVVEWMKTPEWERLLKAPDGIETASADALARFLLAIFTHDRFNDGMFGNAYRSGHVPRIIARFAALATAGKAGAAD